MQRKFVAYWFVRNQQSTYAVAFLGAKTGESAIMKLFQSPSHHALLPKYRVISNPKLRMDCNKVSRILQRDSRIEDTS